METGVATTVSLRLFRHWIWTFVWGLHINLSKIGQELTILENWPWTKIFRPPALGKVIEPRSAMTPSYLIVRRTRNILVPVWSLYDNWFKSYAHFCEKWVRIFCDLDLIPIFTNWWFTMCSTRWNKCIKIEIIIQVSSMLWWYKCWCYWQKMPYPL